jgi:CO dehydrogenase maturation factor
MNRLNGKRILVCGKGGSGKSVFTSLAAKVLDSKGYQVAMLDGDPSNPNGLSRISMGMKNCPRPLIEYLNTELGIRNTEILKPADLKLKLSEIPPRYFLRHENLLLFQAGKVPHQHMNTDIYNHIIKYFTIDDTVMLVDNEPGVKYFDNDEDEKADIVLILVSPEYESIRIAEKVYRFSQHRNIDNVWAVLNNVRSESVATELHDQLISRNIHVLGTVYHDDEIRRAALSGEMIPPCRALKQVSNIIFQMGNRILTVVFSS